MTAISEVLVTLKTERLAVSARLDAIDLAIENLQRAFPTAKSAKKEAAPKVRRIASDDGDAASRRDLLLTAIGRAEMGLTIGDLRRLLPKIEGKERSNALHILKTAGAIKRVGNAWMKAA
jgi:hypothetical protein